MLWVWPRARDNRVLEATLCAVRRIRHTNGVAKR